MADNGRWFKLWCSAVGDPDLDALDIADFGRWAKLGAYIKEHGENGEIDLPEPARSVVSMLQLSSFPDLVQCVLRLPNVTVSYVEKTEKNTEKNLLSNRENSTVSSVTLANVTIHIKYENWFKYQGDFSTDRVRKHREKKGKNETPKKRGEEKRGEEKEKYQKVIEEFWNTYPHRNGIKRGKPETIQAITDNVKSGELDLLLQATRNFASSPDAKKGIGIKDPQRFIVSGRGDKKYSPWKEFINLQPKPGDPGLGNPNAGRDPGL